MAHYPQISPREFGQSLGSARTLVTTFFTEFQHHFGSAPDERGLTDQLLLEMRKKNTTIDWERLSAVQEGTLGYDYCWRFTVPDPHGKAGTGKKVAVYIQAKSYKHQANGNVIADFTYKNNNGLQMDLLKASVGKVAHADATIRVFGGYIVYGSDRVNFIPVDDVLGTYRLSQTKGMNPTAANLFISQHFLGDHNLYAMEDIISYQPPHA